VSESRQYPARPFLGVGALVFREVEGRPQVLLVKRGRPPLVDWWSLPGGIVEVGERLEKALEREVWEETGLEVVVDRLATVFERIMPDAADKCEYHYVLVDFYCSVTGGELRAGDDSKEAAWRDLSELAGIQLTAGTREVIQSCCAKSVTYPFITRP
jgi:8-oxo-dGTP diphosphatase